MSDGDGMAADAKRKLYAISLDENSMSRNNPNVDHEREVAIFDLLDGNSFSLDGNDDGPFRLKLGVVDDRLVMDIGNACAEVLATHAMPMSALRKVIKDYFIMCDTYYEAIRSAPPSRIQAIDMGRRSLHDEGSKILQERLAGKITVDFDTARRLFTLVTAMHWKG